MGRTPDARRREAVDDGLVAGDGRDDDVVALIIAGRDREAAQRGAGLTAALDRPPDTHGGSMDPLAQFDQLGPVLFGVIAGIEPEDLDDPTPCAEFTVRGVLEHMIGGATAFAAAYRGVEPSEPDTADPIAGVQTALGGLAAAINAPGALDRTIAAPFGELDGETFARFVVLDGLIHGWDLAVATGQAYDPPAELVSAVEGFARQALDPLRDGATFAAAVEPPAGATPIEKLAAYTGRRNLEDAR
jgi:uncharacterized protein (TIGR03086 family)